ncbi:hypothetical protein EJ997_11285 [Flaviflexus ciconiae]|uniref:Uncharacterized protein n=1 Tax=Flaviflexus ciconiae TaxID=2496867 RepID=A0A3Q9G5H9_9ACTO|nr:DUF6198 family protein [Flaviflexus ciconiae]AZQ77837.1 hypothetical protein EJ997_11285 [Flaviflexus ciconiae]
MDLSMWALDWLDPGNLALQLLTDVVGCVVLAFGIALEVAPNVLTVPGEGLVEAICIVGGIRLGTVKVFFDSALALAGVICSFIFLGELVGIGIGTIISAFLIGVLVNVFYKRIPWLRTIDGRPKP